MAQMIPDRLPSRASAGEGKLFDALKKLPDDYLVYYEPIIADRYPDFIIIAPDLGLMVIEVKGWRPAEIVAADNNHVHVNQRGQITRQDHPNRQAKGYMFKLKDVCEQHPSSALIRHAEGEHIGKFIFPFGYFSVLSNITSDQLTNHPAGDLTTIFKPSRTVTREQLLSWESLSADQIKEKITTFFAPLPPLRTALNAAQIDVLRGIIHPEIILSELSQRRQPERASSEIPTAQATDTSYLKVLDLRQESLARKIGRGHRIVTGVAGSGKTVLLVARAKWLSEEFTRERPEEKVLLLCFNVPLVTWLEDKLLSSDNVNVWHFDRWATENDCKRNERESNEELGERFLARLSEGYAPDSRQYSAVLIDEAQDFPSVWFKCVLEAMKEPLGACRLTLHIL